MREMRKLFALYGERLTLKQPAGTLIVYGFVQCPLSHGKELPVERTPLGKTYRRQWYYWGDTAVSPDNQLTAKDGVFRVKESGVVRIGEQPVFYRAVLTPEWEAVQ